MLVPKPNQDGSQQPYAFAVATTEMMWACAIAAARATVVSTARGLDFWSQMMRAPAGFQAWPSAPRESAVSVAPPVAVGEVVSRPAAADAPPASETFATYRSASGHAAAQVIVSN